MRNGPANGRGYVVTSRNSAWCIPREETFSSRSSRRKQLVVLGEILVLVGDVQAEQREVLVFVALPITISSRRTGRATARFSRLLSAHRRFSFANLPADGIKAGTGHGARRSRLMPLGASRR